MDAPSSLRSVNHNLLPILRVLLREQSVTRAAEVLGLTQPAASAALAKLRALLDDPLLVKAGRGLRLSPRGEALAPEVEDLCFRMEQLWAKPGFDPRTSQRSFTLTGPDFIQVILAPALIARLAEQAPGISLRFLDAPVDDVTRRRVGSVDFIVSIRQSLEHSAMADFVVEELFRDRTVAVVGPNHRLAKAKNIAFADYEHEDFVVFVGGAQFFEKRYNTLRNAFRTPARPRAVSQHYNALMMIAAETDCVALLPGSLAEVARRLFGFRVIDPQYSDFPIEVCLAWERRHQPDLAHAWMARQIREVASAPASASPDV